MTTKNQLSKRSKRADSGESLVERLATKQLTEQKHNSEQRVAKRIIFDNKVSKFE